MVCSASALASSAGAEILKKGGNAVDAAIACSAVLLAVEPFSCSIGGDAFAIVWFRDKLYGLNGSGLSPEACTAEKLQSLGHKEMPTRGWIPVMVPGLPKSWAALAKRFGNLPLTESLAPAIRCCEEGFALSPVVGDLWKQFYEKNFKQYRNDPLFSEWFRVFTKDGEPYTFGDIVKMPDMAKSLRSIAESDSDSFYHGELAERIDAQSRKEGGLLRKSDLETYDVEWVEPISVNYRGYDVCEIPPNGQGIVALMALNILKNYDFRDKDPLYMTHRQLEAMKIAFADALATVTDPRYMTTDYHLFLEDSYGRSRASEISETAGSYSPQPPHKSGTVYLNAADKDGNMISFITSNYMDFGSGIVIKDTGITLQNRGHDFSLDPKAANYLLPRKRSYHTIIPGFLMKDGKPIGPFGVMGAYMQPQGHVQVLMNLLDRGLPPQAALDLPRWQWIKEKEFLVEPDFDRSLVDALRQKGHTIRFAEDPYSFGRGQVIWRLENGIYTGGTESRSDGSIVVY
ncbi:MAG: gamma-glutamyltransferase family protein [Erysipelotrichaceae bacterium]|nr:gamma-glutamyltransferase family protein [Erysipelotrichaceae bacterium]